MSDILQKKLPKPPVPELDMTLKKYLEYVKVISKEDDYRQTETYVAEFQDKEGPILQEKLIKIANEDNNWVRYWLTIMNNVGKILS